MGLVRAVSQTEEAEIARSVKNREIEDGELVTENKVCLTV